MYRLNSFIALAVFSPGYGREMVLYRTCRIQPILMSQLIYHHGYEAITCQMLQTQRLECNKFSVVLVESVLIYMGLRWLVSLNCLLRFIPLQFCAPS